MENGIDGPILTTARRSAPKSLREFKIDSIAQSWSVLSGAGDAGKALIAHKSMAKMLLHEKYFALIDPALARGFVKPGYILKIIPPVLEKTARNIIMPRCGRCSRIYVLVEQRRRRKNIIVS